MSATMNNLETIYGFVSWQILKYGKLYIHNTNIDDDIKKFITINRCDPTSVIHLKRFIKELKNEYIDDTDKSFDFVTILEIITSYKEYYMLKPITEEWPINLEIPKNESIEEINENT